MLVLPFLNLVVPTMCWSCLLQQHASFHESYKAAKPCDEDHKTEVALLTHTVHRRHQNAPAPADHTTGGSLPAKTAKKPEKAKVDLAAALRSELRLPITIKQIHESAQGPLSHFLQMIHNEFCKALNVEPKRLSILGIRGEYVRLESMLLDEKVVEDSTGLNLSLGLMDAGDVSDPHSHSHTSVPIGAAVKQETKGDTADHEVIVDLEMLPGSKASDPTPKTLFDTLKGLLHTTGSPLTSGPLAGQLEGCELSLGAKPTGRDADQQTAKDAAAHWVPSSLFMLALAVMM